MRIYAPTGARLAHADGLARPLLPGRASGPCVRPGRGCAIVKSPKPRPLIGDIAAQRLWGKGAAAKRAVDVLEGTFPQQRAFIEDPAKLKWALCTRRAAKSYSDGLALAKAALSVRTCRAVGDLLTVVLRCLRLPSSSDPTYVNWRVTFISLWGNGPRRDGNAHGCPRSRAPPVPAPGRTTFPAIGSQAAPRPGLVRASP